jgi:acyl-CoA thioester hydrolase
MGVRGDPYLALGGFPGGRFVVGSRGVSEPEPFRLEIVVTDDDIDALGHASNIVFVRWIQDVALAHSAAVGLDIEAYRRLGAVFVVVRNEIDYLRPAMRGDTIECRTWISSVMAAKCLRSTEIVRREDSELLARSVTTWGFVEMATGRPRRITDPVREAFARPRAAG